MHTERPPEVSLEARETEMASPASSSDARTQKPCDARTMLLNLLEDASSARYAMQEAIVLLKKVSVAHARRLQDRYERLAASIDEKRAALGPRQHVLKCDPDPFAQIVARIKLFEVRKFDRPFRVGDELKLLEFDRATSTYSGAFARTRVTSIVLPGEYGLPPDVGVLGIEVLAVQQVPSELLEPLRASPQIEKTWSVEHLVLGNTR